jgi:uncharacterized protein YydD (DUF2326 family)
MIIETKRKHRVYKDPIIIYEYQTNRNRGFIEKTPIYVIEREKSFKIVSQKGIRYFTYRFKSILKKEESGIVLKSPLQNNSFLYLLADDDDKARELFSEHFDKLKEEEKNKLAQAKAIYNREIAVLDCLSLLEIREDKE